MATSSTPGCTLPDRTPGYRYRTPEETRTQPRKRSPCGTEGPGRICHPPHSTRANCRCHVHLSGDPSTLQENRHHRVWNYRHWKVVHAEAALSEAATHESSHPLPRCISSHCTLQSLTLAKNVLPVRESDDQKNEIR